MSKENVSMTEGPILKNIIYFAVPLMLTGILQQLYNTFDSMVIGKFSSSLALAAIGGSASLTALITNFFIGLSVGTGIIVAQQYGAMDKDALEQDVHTAVALSLVSGVLMTIIGLVVLNPILTLIDTPPEVMPYAQKYVKMYFLGTIPTLLYNFLAGIMRAIGGSKRPLYYLIISAILNIVLNLFFVIVLKMDVDGVAIATIISQTVCCIMALCRLINVDAPYRLIPKKIKLNPKVVVKILRMGVPAGINSCLFSISNLVIQSSINSFGAAAAAGCAADTSIENFVYMPMDAIASSATTYVGQNMGAAEHKRMKKGINCSIGFVTIVGLVLGLLVYVLGTPLLKLFTNSRENSFEVIQYGLQRMSVVAITYFICGIMGVLSGSIRGMGNSLVPMLISVFGVCGLRIIWIYMILPMNNTIPMLFMSYPISWTVTAAILYAYLHRIYRQLKI